MGKRCSCCDASEASLDEKLLVCSRCKSRQYCDKECQVQHWKAFHKKECKALAEQRERLVGVAKLEEGHPAVMTTRNLVTGKKTSKMSHPRNLSQQTANMRQSIAEISATLVKNHSMYVPCSFNLGMAYISQPPMSEFIPCLANFSGSSLEKRMGLGYAQSEYILLTAEMKDCYASRAGYITKAVATKTLAVSPESNPEIDPAALMDELVQAFATKDLRFVVLPYTSDYEVTRDALLQILRNHQSIEHLNLTGYCDMNDATLDLLQTQPNLEYLAFGQDNRYYSSDNVSLQKLQQMVQTCSNLKFLRIFHAIGGRKKKLDPTSARVKDMLLAQGFEQHVVVEAKRIKDEIIANDATQFWRADVEQGYVSATWYVRGIDNIATFYKKHFSAWVF